MNQKFAKTARILFIILMILFILFSIPMAAISVYAFLFTALCALGCFLIARTIKKKYIPQNKNTPNVIKNQNIEDTDFISKTKIPDGEKNYNLFDDFVDKNILIYEYEENICLNDNTIQQLQGKGGEKIDFIPEPQNKYDSSAIAILLDGIKIGYVYRGKIQDMINDWLKRNEFFTGYINKYSITTNKATYKIGFYKPIIKYESKRFPLVKITKKIEEFSTSSRYDNLCKCDNDDFVLIELDYQDNYIVMTESYDEIGELTKSAVDFIESGASPQKIVGILDGCNTNDDLENEIKNKPHVTVYLIK